MNITILKHNVSGKAILLLLSFFCITQRIKALPVYPDKADSISCCINGSPAGADTAGLRRRTNIFREDSLFSFRSQKGFFPSLLHNTAAQATAPFHFSKKDWIITGSLAVLTAGLVSTDGLTDNTTKVLKSEHTWIRKSSPVITSFGSRAGYGTVIAFGTLSAVFKNKKGVETSLLAGQAVITSGLWVQMIKILSGRQRPFRYDITGNSVAGHWYGPFAQYRNDLAKEIPGAAFESFPSGHTATAFSIATVFAMQYSDIKAVPVLSYSAATLVGVSRLTEHRHWLSDVFAGAVLGYFCGKQVVNHHRKLMNDSGAGAKFNNKRRAEISLISYNNQAGIRIVW